MIVNIIIKYENNVYTEICKEFDFSRENSNDFYIVERTFIFNKEYNIDIVYNYPKKKGLDLFEIYKLETKNDLLIFKAEYLNKSQPIKWQINNDKDKVVFNLNKILLDKKILLN
ncbi:MAG: hypothetical protein H7239_15910 [Flavobacterium sp.]|nr:hypothetical protein [Flavobacterium sp.]